MNKTVITIAVLLGLSGLGYLWWKSYDLSSKYDFKFKGYKIDISGLKTAKIQLYLDLINKFGKDITIKSYNFDVSLNGVNIANIVNNNLIKLANNQSTPITLVATFNPLLVAKTGLNLQTLQDFFTDKSKIIVGIKGKISTEVLGISVNDIPVNVKEPLTSFIA